MESMFQLVEERRVLQFPPRGNPRSYDNSSPSALSACYQINSLGMEKVVVLTFYLSTIAATLVIRRYPLETPSTF